MEKRSELMKMLIAGRSDADLVEDWKELDKRKVTDAVARVRGLYMDELEKRFPEAFDRWIEGDEDILDILKESH